MSGELGEEAARLHAGRLAPSGEEERASPARESLQQRSLAHPASTVDYPEVRPAALERPGEVLELDFPAIEGRRVFCIFVIVSGSTP